VKKIRLSVLLFLIACSLLLLTAAQTSVKKEFCVNPSTQPSSWSAAETNWIGTGHHSETIFNSLSSSIPTICKEQSKVLYLLKDSNKKILAHAFGQYASYVTNLSLLNKQQQLNFPFHDFW
jgi:hypothetical protein